MWLCRTHPVVPVLKGGVLTDRVQAVSCFLSTRVCGCGAVQRCQKRRRLPADDCQDGRLYKCVMQLWWAWWEPHAVWVGVWCRRPQPIHLSWALSDRWRTESQVSHSSYWSDVDLKLYQDLEGRRWRKDYFHMCILSAAEWYKEAAGFWLRALFLIRVCVLLMFMLHIEHKDL